MYKICLQSAHTFRQHNTRPTFICLPASAWNFDPDWPQGNSRNSLLCLCVSSLLKTRNRKHQKLNSKTTHKQVQKKGRQKESPKLLLNHGPSERWYATRWLGLKLHSRQPILHLGLKYSPNIDGFSANIYEIVFIYGFTLILRSF